MHRLISVTVFAMILAMAPTLHAQQYPSKPIRIIIPFPPGDSLDTMSRLIAPTLTERLGQNIVVDNRAGAAGQLGLDLAAHAAPDGYTLVGGQGGNLVVQPHTYKKLPYDPLKDFAPVAISTTNFLALVINPSLPFKSLNDLVTYGKANPGKLSFASNGEGGFPHKRLREVRETHPDDRLATPIIPELRSPTLNRKGRQPSSLSLLPEGEGYSKLPSPRVERGRG